MTKQMLLKIETCRNCPFVRETYAWFVHCTHPKLKDLQEKEKRISCPGKDGNTELNIPEWCPLEELEK